MALSLDTLRNQVVTSIFGRRMGLDSNDFLVGPKGLRQQVEDLTTAATTVAGFGISRVTATGSSQGPVQYTLPSPAGFIGTIKYLALATTSTGSYQFLSTANGASILAASDGTTKALVNLVGQGGVVGLMAVSSAAWQVVSSVSTGGVSYTTST